MAFCRECGAKLADGAKYCGTCGHEVTAKAKPADEIESPSAEPVVQAVRELAGTVVREIDAPSTIGESTLCTWKSVGAGSAPAAAASAATQAVGAAAHRAASAGAEQMRQGLMGETAQFVAQRERGSSSSQSRGKHAPTAKRSKLPVILIAVGAVALVALFALYVAPRFVFHPVDPNEHTALVSDSSRNASSAASSHEASSTGVSSASAEASSASAEASSNATSASGGASSTSSEAASSTAAPTSFSTDERPSIRDFKWLDGEAMKGNAPAGAQRIVDLGALTGGWKGYIVGPNMEWLANADIEVGQEGVTIAIDWYYIRDASGNVHEDTTTTSMFTGTFDGGMLDVTGSGRITIATFWQQEGRQYGVGSYILPSGESATIALVRP